MITEVVKFVGFAKGMMKRRRKLRDEGPRSCGGVSLGRVGNVSIYDLQAASVHNLAVQATTNCVI